VTATDVTSSTTVVLDGAMVREVLATRARFSGQSRWHWERTYLIRIVIADFLVGLIAAIAALEIRFGEASGASFNRNYLYLTAVMPFIWVITLTLNRTYDTRHLFVGNDEYQRVFRAGLGLTAAVAIISFAFDLTTSRGYVVVAMPLATVLDLCLRYLARHRLHGSWAHGDKLRRVVLVGPEAAINQMTRQLRSERYHGLGVVGACVPARNRGPATAIQFSESGLPIFGSFDDVATAVRQSGADTVVALSCPELDGAALRRLAWRLETDDIDLVVASTLVDVAGNRTTLRPVDGLPLMHVEHPRLTGPSRVVKTAFDKVSAGLALILFSPVLLGLSLLIRYERGARGPALFKQVRVGKDGREFTIYKFRTMHVDAEERLAALRHLNQNDGVLFKMRDDPRVTRIGKILRKLSLDELPQLLNVIKGQMSLVGPRPPLASEVALYPEDMMRRLAVKPGMTGLWQVSGRSDLSWEESMRLDLRYVENWSLFGDLVILGRTCTAVLRSSGAY
jgi:exopolysaccharide biosynthesis polyprenyl glycosylphosphotransferase